MKYLFFDCEFANCFDGKEKICEFGYVMVNEKFDILYKGNLIINPNIKPNEWDWYALKKILTRKREEYESMLFFPSYHMKIVALIKNADYILGHTIDGDVHALNCELQRYNLPCLNFEFYDIKEMFKAYADTKKTLSVENILTELGIRSDGSKHDAGVDAYNTMLELKTILEKLEFKLEEMIEICPSAKDKTENFLISSRIRVEQTKVTREDRQTRKQNAAKRKIGQTMWGDLYREHKPLLEDLNSVGKFLTISGEMKEHHEELKNLIQIIKDKGYVAYDKINGSDYLIVFDEKNRKEMLAGLKYPYVGQTLTYEEFLNLNK